MADNTPPPHHENGPPVRIFVYGSLLSGQERGDLLGAFPKVPATVQGTLYRLAGGYPALVPSEGGRAIRGELVTAYRGVLPVLDLYEDVPGGLYRRAAVVALVDGTPTRCLSYVLREQDVRRRRAVRLDTDDWRRISPRGVLR
jgi:gamma-glutamylcyclotransferase (GGCT)/AIG2-like uncharacterized protein YtfP